MRTSLHSLVLVADPTNQEQVQAISARLWTAGYLPGQHAGVSFRTKGDPILFINNPPGVSSEVRRTTLDGISALNQLAYQKLVIRNRDPYQAIRDGVSNASQCA